MKKYNFPDRSNRYALTHIVQKCRQVEISFLGMPQIAHFSSRKMKNLPVRSLRSLSKIVPPSIFLAHYATATGVYTGGGGGGLGRLPPAK